MPMNGDLMGQEALAAVQALPPGDPSKSATDPANAGTQLDPQASMKAMFGAVVAHIRNNANLVIQNTAAFDAMQNGTTHPGSTFTSPAGVIE